MQNVNYVSKEGDGHHSEYDRLLTAELGGLNIRLERIASAGQALDAGAPLFYSMLDSETVTFLARAIARSFLGRKTVGLFFRPRECLQTDSPRLRMKKNLFHFVSRLPNVSILTIIPFTISPDFSEVATGWIYDPQLWDLMYFGVPAADAFPARDAQIREAARGRRVMMVLGGQNPEKGFDYMVQIWEASQKIREAFLFVVAGKVQARSAEKANRFTEQGGLLIDERLKDAEFLHLYSRADIIWSCYAPNYNQASGIHGRAVQLGVPVIVREGSYLEYMAGMLCHPTLALPFDNADAAAQKLLNWKPFATAPDKRDALVRDMREHSLSVLAKALS